VPKVFTSPAQLHGCSWTAMHRSARRCTDDHRFYGYGRAYFWLNEVVIPYFYEFATKILLVHFKDKMLKFSQPLVYIGAYVPRISLIPARRRTTPESTPIFVWNESAPPA